MKNLKLLNKKNLSIFIFFILIFSNNLKAEEEPIDIWKLENNTEQNSDNIILDNDQNDEINIDLKNSEKNPSKVSKSYTCLFEAKLALLFKPFFALII